jgi:phosphoserine phosphatase
MSTAFFDYDGTLIEGDSILFWLRYYYSRRPARRVFQIANAGGLFLHGAGLISSHTLKRVFLWPMAFEKPEALDALAEGFVRDDLSLRFHGPVRDRLWAHHRLGHRTVVISASGIFYLRHLRGWLPPDCTLLGTEIDFAKGFLRFPAYRDGNLRGSNKIKRLRGLGFAGAGPAGFAYSDHHHDLPLLEFVDHANCIRPTAKLEKVARERGWPIWDWPRARSYAKLKAEAVFLLLFAAAPRFLAADPARAERGSEAGVEEQMRLVAETLAK